MRYRIASTNKIKESFILEGEKEYLKRFPKDVRVECLCLGGERFGDLESKAQKKKHFELLMKSREKGEFLVLLDERGKQFSSQELAQFFNKKMLGGDARFLLAIGGPYGWSEEAREEADLVLSLSKLTFPNQIARLLCVEQLYRVTNILKGGNYHKE
ncbi:MAG: 23S rRNA (pseudouridine(1915)-N(3))-methyltransferase RlmH [Bdellovibrionales bacterium]|nr:23S rRNA (pseudouridine(1915)-N(3))-methyltransferase RlmH [Bdellovibrionales bacterium]